MSSHRETPASTLLSRASLLAAVQMPGAAVHTEQPIQLEPAQAADLHVNLNITDFYIFQKPDDPAKSILIMNVNPMPPRSSDSFDPTASFTIVIDPNKRAAQTDFFGDPIDLQLEQWKID